MKIEDCCKTLAEAYRDGAPWHIPAELVENFREQVEFFFNRIPVPVRWVSDLYCRQPFDTAHKMETWTEERGELLMLSEFSDELGRDLYSKHRAVHDWFGHVAADQPFGGEGEAKSFLVHTAQYTPEVLPIVFSDVVLTNNYWQHFGHAWGSEKWVYRPDLIELVKVTYR